LRRQQAAWEYDMKEPLRELVSVFGFNKREPAVETRSQLPAVLPGSAVDDSLQRHSRMGWIVLGLFFGVLGLWSVTAPLNGAVVADALIKVEGNRKAVQHLDGGIVKQLNVKEGDRVAAGDIVMVLDDSQASAEYDVYFKQEMVLRATQARLMAELNRKRDPVAPPEIEARLNEPAVDEIWDAQLQQFKSRRASLEGQRKVVRERINQLIAQVDGNEKQLGAFGMQMDSVEKEIASIAPLVEQGLIARPRLLQLERMSFGLEGQFAGTTADMAKARQAIAEQEQQLAQLDNDRMTEVTKELRDTQAMLLEVIPRVTNARAVLGRMDIRAPYAGTVVGLSVFAVGAVISRGEKILDIVPDDNALTVEAQITVDQISDVHPGMLAEVHLTAYKQRITPMVRGTVIQVSADRLTDPRTGFPYYTTLVRIDQKDLDALPEVKLYPGMPAQVMIPTVERTAMDYLIGPLFATVRTAFRQR
jgi:HlyD family type I secretion membrane fusion protein